MEYAILKGNENLLELLQDAVLKSESSLDELKDLDAILLPGTRPEFVRRLRAVKGKCYFQWGTRQGESKFIVPLQQAPYFRLVHLSEGGVFKRPQRLSFKLARLRSVFRYAFSGSAIVLLGVDGSGKSTIAQELKTRLKPFFNVEIEYFGWKQLILPLKRTKRRPISHKQGQEKVGWIYLLVYYLEMWLRYMFRVMPKLLLGRVVICDRYFYDKLVHLEPRSFRGRFFGLLTPRPHLGILITAEPSLIAARKPETTAEQAAQKQALYRAQAGRLGLREVRNESTFDEVLSQIILNLQPTLIKRKVAIE